MLLRTSPVCDQTAFLNHRFFFPLFLWSVWSQPSAWHRFVLMCFQLFVGTEGVWNGRILPLACELITILTTLDSSITSPSDGLLFKATWVHHSAVLEQKRVKVRCCLRSLLGFFFHDSTFLYLCFSQFQDDVL